MNIKLLKVTITAAFLLSTYASQSLYANSTSVPAKVSLAPEESAEIAGPGAALAGDLIWDYGPSSGTLNGCWSNFTGSQNFAEDVTFTNTTNITSIVIFTCIAPTAGTVHIKVRDDAGAVPSNVLLYDADVVPTSWVPDPDTGGYAVSADLPGGFSATGGTTYWIGMSGNGFELGHYAVRTPDDALFARFTGPNFDQLATEGDQMFQLFSTGGPAIGMVVDDSTGFDNVFDPSTDTVTDNVAMTTGSAEGDCTISADGSLGFFTNFDSVIQVVDLLATPAVLAGPPIPISNPGEDVSLTPDGNFLVTSDGSGPDPLSIIDIGTMTEVGTFTFSSSHTSVEVCSDGTVLSTNVGSTVSHGTIDGAGIITASGASLPGAGNMNAYCASGNLYGVAISNGGTITSFALPGMALIDTQATTGGGAQSAVFNAAGTVLFVRTGFGVDAYNYDPNTGLFGGLVWSTATGGLTIYYGMEQIALHPDGSKLYASGGTAPVEILDPATGASLGSMSDPGISNPTGICLAGSSAPPNNPPVADAGPDQVVECAGDPNTTVQLDGSGSFDPDAGDSIAAYLWTGGTFNPDDMTVNPTVDVPLGVHVFGLEVFDTFGLSDTDSVQVTVSDTTDPVIVAPADISVEHTADPQFVSDLDLGMPTVTEACGYTVSRSPAGNLFPVGTTTITWTVTANSDGATASDTQDVVITNTAPVADDQSPVVVEDSLNNVITLTASDINNDSPLVYGNVTLSVPFYGSLIGTPPNMTYTPAADYFGSDDSFTFTATDEHGATSAPATVSITVTPVNDPPVISISRAMATVQYSDTIGTVTITATDVDDDPLTLSSEYTDNGGAPIAGLPSNLGTAGGCVTVPNDTTSPGTSCSWDLTGQMLEDAGDYDITLTVTDGGGGEGTIESDSGVTEIIVNAEDASISFDENNEVAIQVDGDGSDSSLPFSLTVYIDETEPDLATFVAMYGDLSLAVPHMILTPVGPGGPEAPVSCDAPSVAGTGYDQVMTFTCHFAGVPVNTYSVDVSVDGGYYTGENDDVFTVFDPSLGFTTGGGWFYWPGTNDKTNFGYVMKYNKKRTNLQGSLLMIRHVEGSTTGEKWRIKSNALEGLAIGNEADFGWASFSGKATYRSPTEENEGNNEFTVYVEDHGVPGKGVDQFWVQTRDKEGNVRPDLSMPEPGAGNTETIEGGNIFVPHTSKGRGK